MVFSVFYMSKKLDRLCHFAILSTWTGKKISKC